MDEVYGQVDADHKEHGSQHKPDETGQRVGARQNTCLTASLQVAPQHTQDNQGRGWQAPDDLPHEQHQQHRKNVAPPIIFAPPGEIQIGLHALLYQSATVSRRAEIIRI